MMPSHDTLVYFAKTFGLFYLIACAVATIAYTLRPSLRARYDQAARSVLIDEDKPCP